MGVSINGRDLGVATNGSFSASNTDPIPGGSLWPEAALTWNAMRRAYEKDGGNPADFVPAGPNSSARSRAAQDHFWHLFVTGQGAPAARPYTSNHGWAIAVDVATRAAAAWLLAHGEFFGWSHDEGARVGEWWHYRYVGASKSLLRRLRREAAGPWAYLTRRERKWAEELTAIRAYVRAHGGHWDNHPERRARAEALKRVLTKHRKMVWRAAQGPGGWKRNHRLERYRALAALTR